MSAELAGKPDGGFIQRWDDFWYKPVDPTTVCFVRLCAGLVIFYVHLCYSFDLFGYVGPEGWVSRDIAVEVQRSLPTYELFDDWRQGITQRTGHNSFGNFYWSFYYHVTDPTVIVLLHVAFLAAMLMFALGLFTPLTGFVSWVGAMNYVQRSNNTVYGLDTMMMLILLYLMVAPSGAVLSLDRWWQKRMARGSGKPVPPVEKSAAANFALRLIQIHFCIVYFGSGTSKLLGPTWWGGTALNLVITNVNFAPMDNYVYYNFLRWLASHRGLWETAMAFGIVYTLALEISFPFLIWDDKWRSFLICCSVLLHLGIGLTMGLVTFSVIMIAMVASFVPPENIRALIDAVTGLFRGSARPAVAAPVASRGELVASR